MTAATTASTPPWLRWLPVLACFAIAIAGYFGVWVPHRAAGLVVTGVDLAEYVKFLPPVQSGGIRILREAFYVPLLAASLIASLLASRRSLARWLRVVAFVVAVPLALAMLPPAWSPGMLLQPDFRIQVLAIALCFGVLFIVPVLPIVPDALALFLIALLCIPAALWPAWSFVQVLPPIRELYRTNALLIGWGFWLTLAGFLTTALFALVAALRRP